VNSNERLVITDRPENPDFKSWFQDGIIHFEFYGDLNDTVAKNVMETTKRFLQENGFDTKPILVDMKDIKEIPFSTRRYLASEGGKLSTAIALVTRSKVQAFLANTYMSFTVQIAPAKLFYTIGEAKKWLQGFQSLNEIDKENSFRGSVFTCYQDSHGIVHNLYDKDAVIDLDVIKENVELSKNFFQGEKILILTHIQKIRDITKEAREYISSEKTNEVSKKVAIIVGSPLSRLAGNLLLKVDTPIQPTKLFADESSARQWLLKNETSDVNFYKLSSDKAQNNNEKVTQRLFKIIVLISSLAALLFTILLFQSGQLHKSIATFAFSILASIILAVCKNNKCKTSSIVQAFLVSWLLCLSVFILTPHNTTIDFLYLALPVPLIATFFLGVKRGVIWTIISIFYFKIHFIISQNVELFSLKTSNFENSINIHFYALSLETIIILVLGIVFDYLNRQQNQQISDTLIQEEEAIQSTLGILMNFSRFDFSKKAKVIGDGRIFDDLARGINILGEEFEHSLAQAKATESTKRLVSMGEMASGIAHEINTPLAAINLTSSILKKEIQKDDLNRERARKMINDLQTVTKQISKIVNSLRTISRDSSQDPFEDTKINELIENALTLCNHNIKHNNVNFEIMNNLEDDESINCRPSEIVQVLINLINNSVDAVSECEEKIVKLKVVNTGDNITFSVIDSGTGIEEKDLNSLFDPFFTTKDPGKGTGLGLSISKRIVETHGGVILAKSGKLGTTFEFTLPLQGPPKTDNIPSG
jgi:signal transduction histidine kinase